MSREFKNVQLLLTGFKSPLPRDFSKNNENGFLLQEYNNKKRFEKEKKIRMYLRYRNFKQKEKNFVVPSINSKHTLCVSSFQERSRNIIPRKEKSKINSLSSLVNFPKIISTKHRYKVYSSGKIDEDTIEPENYIRINIRKMMLNNVN